MPNPMHELQRARAALTGGQPTAAVRVCRKLLTDNPRNLDARHLHGRALAALARWGEAAAEFRRVLATRGDFTAMVELGIAETFAGNLRDAQAILRQARAIDARPAQLHFALGLCSLSAGDPEGAVAAFTCALEREPRFPDALNNLGVAHDRLGQFAVAAACFRRATMLHPGYADAHRNLGDVLSRIGDTAGAVAAFREAARCRPDDATAMAELAAAERAAAQPAACGEVAAATYVTTTLETAGQLERDGRPDDAISLLRTAAVLHPRHAELAETQGALLHRLGRLPEALDCYEYALDIDGTRAHTLLNCGRALESLGAPGRAIAYLERALALLPTEPQILGSLVSSALRLCDWDRADTMLAALRRLPNGIDGLQPFVLLATDHDPADVTASLARRFPDVPAAAMPAPSITPSAAPLRVAYLSPDFRAHPVAYAIAGMIEHHDRSRVSPIGVALKAGDGSAIDGRLRGAFDHYIDAANLSDGEIVTLLAERGVDIAIDLAGLTTGSRTAIFERRAARTQINFLGYPGTMGRSFIDVIVADREVLPVADEAHYREHVLRMPHAYLPFDDARVLPPPVTRTQAGLPPGFVFCAFNNSYKITRAIFEVWMHMLRDTPDSVLWLRSMGAEAANRLRTAASRHEVAPERLVFASFEPAMETHLARLQLADLFLDTLPYNAHTTAAEALWAGVPVISCRGTAFAGRVGASLLTACGLPELICADLAGYRQLATELAHTPSRLEDLRERLRRDKASLPLFDTRRYARDFEALLYTAHRLTADGRHPKR